MTFDDGLVGIYKLEDIATPGDMPAKRLVKYTDCFFGERVVGYGRQYAAKGVNEQIDMLIRVWQDRKIRTGMIAIIEKEQFRIDNVQHMLDEDGLKVSDLTLARLEDFYDIDAGETSGN